MEDIMVMMHDNIKFRTHIHSLLVCLKMQARYNGDDDNLKTK